MEYDKWRSLPAMFFDQAARLGTKPFLWAKRDRVYRPLSWAQVAREVRQMALGLKRIGIGRGERVGLMSENRPEWIIADLARLAVCFRALSVSRARSWSRAQNDCLRCCIAGGMRRSARAALSRGLHLPSNRPAKRCGNRPGNRISHSQSGLGPTRRVMSSQPSSACARRDRPSRR